MKRRLGWSYKYTREKTSRGNEYVYVVVGSSGWLELSSLLGRHSRVQVVMGEE